MLVVFLSTNTACLEHGLLFVAGSNLVEKPSHFGILIGTKEYAVHFQHPLRQQFIALKLAYCLISGITNAGALWRGHTFERETSRRLHTHLVVFFEGEGKIYGIFALLLFENIPLPVLEGASAHQQAFAGNRSVVGNSDRKAGL